jgi:hypothetical protein
MKPATAITPGAGMTDPLVIPSRFCGPPDSGNGGYVCGRIAAYFDGPVTVTLRRPPPLVTPMTVERDGEGSVRIHHGGTVIAEATSSPESPASEIPAPVSMAEAHAVAGGARYYTDPVPVPPGRGIPERHQVLDLLVSKLPEATGEPPLWPGDNLISPPDQPAIMPYLPHGS